VHRMGVVLLLRLSLILNLAGCFALAWAGESMVRTVLAIIAIGAGSGLPYAALFTRAAALFPGRAGAAMGLVNMLGIIMILAAPPLIGRLVDASGSFLSSFIALGCFSLLVCLGTFGIDQS
jgi:cyanate permease